MDDAWKPPESGLRLACNELRAGRVRRLGDLAVARGWITDRDLDECIAELDADRSHQHLGAVLLARRRLTAQQLSELMRELNRQDAWSIAREGPAGRMEEIRQARQDPSRCCDQYVLVEKLGEGGMGSVWKAWDRELNRWVALKLLHMESSRAFERFAREAKMAGRLNHPNLVTIYGVGRTNGVPYIAMQYVEGVPPRHGSVPIGRAVEVVRDAARAVHFAHVNGVIHRDIKPDNLLIDGEGRVYVADFGVAKQIETPIGMTLAGAVLGTPCYMAPEQARGDNDAVSAASDVFSLGATLFELVTGRPPYLAGSSAEAIPLAIACEPSYPRRLNPKLNPDIEAIVLKAMEKDPGRRYPSAEAMAADLTRQIDGEVVAARQATWMHRLRKRVQRNPRLYGVGSIGAAGILLSLAVLVPMWMSAERRVELERAEALAEMRATAEVTLKAALKMRAKGDPDSMVEFLAPLEAACNRAIEKDPGSPEPHYHLGRMYRAQMRFEDAWAQQESALAKDADFAPSLYERVVLRAARYRRRLALLLREAFSTEGVRLEAAGMLEPGSDRRALRMPRREELEGGDPEIALLKRDLIADANRLDRVGGLDPLQIECARAIVEVVTGEGESGESRMRRVLEAKADLEEAYETLAQAASDRMDFETAADWCVRGRAVDAGYIPHSMNLAEALYKSGVAVQFRGGDPAEAFGRSVDAYTEVLRLSPTSTEALLGRARARHHWIYGTHEAPTGPDVDPIDRMILDDFDAAVAIAPDSAEARIRRAEFLGQRGDALRPAGLEGAMELYRSALEDLDVAAASDPNNYRTPQLRGIVQLAMSNVMFDEGEEWEDTIEAAFDSINASLRLNPAVAEGYLCRAIAHGIVGDRLRKLGRDPLPSFERCVLDFEKAFELKPSLRVREALRIRVNVLMGWGLFEQLRGKDPSGPFVRALDDLGRMLETDPANASAQVQRAEILLNWGDYESSIGVDAVPRYKDALAALDSTTAAELPRQRSTDLRARIYVGWGRYLTARGEDPDEPFEKAVTALTEILVDGTLPDAVRLKRAHLLSEWAKCDQRRGWDAMPRWKRAIEDLDALLNRSPRDGRLRMRRAGARLALGTNLMERGDDPSEAFRGAVEDLDALLGAGEAPAGALMTRALAWLNWGIWIRTNGGDSRSAFTKAAADFGGVLAGEPDRTDALWYRGRCYADLEAWDQAAADLERAAKIDPASAANYRDLIELVRGRMSDF